MHRKHPSPIEKSEDLELRNFVRLTIYFNFLKIKDSTNDDSLYVMRLEVAVCSDLCLGSQMTWISTALK